MIIWELANSIKKTSYPLVFFDLVYDLICEFLLSG